MIGAARTAASRLRLEIRPPVLLPGFRDWFELIVLFDGILNVSFSIRIWF